MRTCSCDMEFNFGSGHREAIGVEFDGSASLRANELVMTQELVANMLGVRREGVTEAALKLQQAGLIRYVRGHISVLDRPGLEKRTCECYAVVKKEYERLLPEKLAT